MNSPGRNGESVGRPAGLQAVGVAQPQQAPWQARPLPTANNELWLEERRAVAANWHPSGQRVLGVETRRPISGRPAGQPASSCGFQRACPQWPCRPARLIISPPGSLPAWMAPARRRPIESRLGGAGKAGEAPVALAQINYHSRQAAALEQGRLARSRSGLLFCAPANRMAHISLSAPARLLAGTQCPLRQSAPVVILIRVGRPAQTKLSAESLEASWRPQAS